MPWNTSGKAHEPLAVGARADATVILAHHVPAGLRVDVPLAEVAIDLHRMWGAERHSGAAGGDEAARAHDGHTQWVRVS